MNLFYLRNKKAAVLLVSGEVDPFRHRLGENVWTGVRLASGSALTIKNATRYQPFRGRADNIGWWCLADDQSDLIIEMTAQDGAVVAKQQVTATPELQPLLLPWPLDVPDGHLNLSIRSAGKTPIMIASAREINRAPLYAMCVGTGVEIGPGPSPQITPRDGVNIFYVERSTPDEWVSLYGAHYRTQFRDDLLDRYIIGEAHDIPCEPDSLDFIFSSHVFEHLVNPLGHLERWHALLKPGGRIVMVVPDYIGSKDYLADPSTVEQIIDEYHVGNFAPTIEHFKRFARSRDDENLHAKLMKKNSSIHVHFYSNDNMSSLLEEACQRFGYSRYAIRHTSNHKDFHAIMVK